MREQLITLACAVGAGLLFLALLLPGPSTPPASRPTSEAEGGAGYRAARQWLTQVHVPVLSLRDPLTTLPSPLSPTGNLLILTLPAAEPYSPAEVRALRDWTAAGNTLLVLAALADAPEWAWGASASAAADVSLLTGLTLEPLPQTPLSHWERSTLVPTRPDVMFEGVSQAIAHSAHPARGWRLLLPHEGFVLTLARARESTQEALWVGVQGRGRIYLSAFSSLFSDRGLTTAGNARLLANLVASTVGEGGSVLFDDLHQGLTDLYDPARFYRDPRLYQSLAVLGLVWLIWVVGGTARLRASPVPSPPGELALVQAGGRMLARVLPPQEAARGLLERFFQRVRAHTPPTGEPSDTPPWQALERHPRLAHQDLQQLRAWHEATMSGHRIPLARLHNLLQHLERQMRA